MAGGGKNTKIKFTFEDPECLAAGVELLTTAYRCWERGKTKIEAIEKAVRNYSRKYRLPGNEALRDMLTEIIEHAKERQLISEKGKRKTARVWVMNEVLKQGLGIKEPELVMTIKAEELNLITGEEQVPGQMEMDLTPPEEQKAEMSDTTKMMRFNAGQADKTRKTIEENVVLLISKMDQLNDTLHMILRCIRKE